MTPAERDLYIRTLIGEAGGESPQGQAAVAHVIRNRLMSGRFGGDINSVIMAPKQFSTWNPGDPAGIMANRVPADSPRYQSIGKIVDSVNSGQTADPTSGALNFYNPRAASPAWGNTMANRITIGNHDFGTAGGGGAQPRVASAPSNLAAQTAVSTPVSTDAAPAAGGTSPAGPQNPEATQPNLGSIFASLMSQPAGGVEAPRSAPSPQLPADLFTIQNRGPASGGALQQAPRPQAPLDEDPYQMPGMTGLLPQVPGRPVTRLT
jgi:hypothetical protein